MIHEATTATVHAPHRTVQASPERASQIFTSEGGWADLLELFARSF